MSGRADERPARNPQPGEDMNPTSVNIAAYEAERRAAEAKVEEKPKSTTKKTGADKR